MDRSTDLSSEDRARISAAIHAAEQRTSGEIVCVLAERSVDATGLPILIAAVIALLAPWLLVHFTMLPVAQILLIQAALFVVLLPILCLPRLRAALLPARVRRAIAHRVAMEQFALRGVSRTKDRTGILVFVSLAERYARIIADEGIAARVPQAEWQRAIDALIGHMRDGRIADGFIVAIDRCADVLATHFPHTDAPRDELPDRIYLI
ncbi:putative membrane protein [Enhydrobacter aerosaccus]|uniref:Putative membrane protein n=1 Tax=Enhydrobacter aerosaccus TaxID=225324 RepID=A0A1T4SRN0_9HYPH|nr:TPM domain-containing protein [Enhydrobacter aerosaccus]SKA30812.1 putative membrane protein [Enhydrobacter aerosaccus]